MAKFFVLFGALTISFSVISQNAELVLEKTDSKSMFYDQYSGKIELEVPTRSSDNIKLDLGAGSKEIYQSDNNVISVKAEVILSAGKSASAYKIVEKFLTLEFTREENTVIFTSMFDFDDSEDEVSGKNFFTAPERKVNLTVYVPKDLDLKIIDRSGELEIADIENNLIVKDGSGGLEISGVIGNLKVVDHSGDLLIKDINEGSDGDYEINIKDYSGGLRVKNVKGKTSIDDNSGELSVSKLKGSLKVYDTSGAIYLKNIIGDSRIDDTSGEINAEKIDGTIIISDTSGGININEVSKDVIVKRDGSGSIRTTNIGGIVKN